MFVQPSIKCVLLEDRKLENYLHSGFYSLLQSQTSAPKVWFEN